MSSVVCSLCFWFSLFCQQSITYDFSFTISKEAFSDKLLAGYTPGINNELSSKVFPGGSNGAKGDKIHSKWSDITVAYYSPLQVNKNLRAYLNPTRQTIDFKISDLILHSNIFNITFTYKPHPIINTHSISCDGNAQILIDNYNISVSYHLKTAAKSKKVDIDDNSTDKININDCQLKIEIDEDSVQIDAPKNNMPLDYTFANELCYIIFDNEYIEKVIRKYLNFFFKFILPVRWQKYLEKMITQFEQNRQILSLTYDNTTTYELICYRNNSISWNGDLVVNGLFVNNGSIDYHSHSGGMNTTNMTTPHIQHHFNAVVVITCLSVSFLIVICCLIGCFCTLKECIIKPLSKMKDKEKKDVIEEYYSLHISDS